MRALVIGGRGFVGSKVVTALTGLPHADVWVGSRSNGQGTSVKLDLTDPTTFSTMDSFDYIVNCSDSLKAPPDSAIDYCLKTGLTFIELSADLGTVDRILTEMRAEDRGTQESLRGLVILGIGLFPGLSNLMAKAAYDLQPGCERLELGFRIMPFSGSGAGTASLVKPMVEAPAIWYENGQRVSDRPGNKGVGMPFVRGEALTVKWGLPEAVMLHHSLRLPSTATYLATRPVALGKMMAALPGLLPRRPFFRRLLLAVMGYQGTFLKAFLLRKVREPIEITAMADRRHCILFWTNDGFVALGYVVAAALIVLSSRAKPKPGLYLPDELFEMNEILNQMGMLAGERLAMSLETRVLL